MSVIALFVNMRGLSRSFNFLNKPNWIFIMFVFDQVCIFLFAHTPFIEEVKYGNPNSNSDKTNLRLWRFSLVWISLKEFSSKSRSLKKEAHFNSIARSSPNEISTKNGEIRLERRPSGGTSSSRGSAALAREWSA